MKPLPFALAFAAICCAAAVQAQLPAENTQNQATIKVTTKINANGTRTDTQKDLEARTSEIKTYDKNQKLIQRAAFALDEQGRETEGVIYNGQNKTIGGVSFKYDPQGRVSEQAEKNPAGIVTRRVVLRYDPATGRLVGAEAYDGQGKKISQDSDTPTTAPKIRKKK